jgi:adenosylhomocysteinase
LCVRERDARGDHVTMHDELLAQGRDSVSRTAEQMPVLSRLTEEARTTQPLAGHRIAGCVHLTRQTGVLINALVAAGARIAWTGGDEMSTQDDVAAALAADGVAVFGRSKMTTGEVTASIGSVLDEFPDGPTMLVDNGARMIREALDRDKGFQVTIIGGTEKTTEGVRALTEVQDRLTFPVLAVNSSIIKLTVDNGHGTGQSTLDGVLRATAILLAGKTVVVVGFGPVGHGVAARARAMGARVIVVCRSPRTAVRARLAGFGVAPLESAVAEADLVCTATGFDRVIVGSHLDRLRDGAILCNTGRSMTEIALDELADRTVKIEQIRPHVTRYVLNDGRKISLLAQGGLVNLAAAEGNASEVMDLTFAHQYLAILRLAREPQEPGLYPVPAAEDEAVAALKLEAMGIRHDQSRAGDAKAQPAAFGHDDAAGPEDGPEPGKPGIVSAATRLAWAQTQMPVLAALRERCTQSPLARHRVAICGHVTRESAIQWLTIQALGADVACCPSEPTTTDEGIAAELRARGVTVYGRRGMSPAEARRAIDDTLTHWGDQSATLVLDEGGDLIDALVHDHARRAGSVCGAVEKTPTGKRRLLSLQEEGRLPFPVLEIDDCFGKREVDNPHGTAQSLILTIIACGGLLLAGKTFVVAGYGAVGSGLAQRARGLGAEVIVTEVLPTRALFASLEGFTVLPMEEALVRADVVCTVTGMPNVITGGQFDLLRSGAVLANGGHYPWEINLRDLSERCTSRTTVAPGNELLELRTGQRIHLLGGGHVVNIAAGSGNAAEVMDATFATQVLSLLFVAEQNGNLPNVVQQPPAEADDFVAARLAAAQARHTGWRAPSP